MINFIIKKIIYNRTNTYTNIHTWFKMYLYYLMFAFIYIYIYMYIHLGDFQFIKENFA